MCPVTAISPRSPARFLLFDNGIRNQDVGVGYAQYY